jgi:hypothetical protein
MAIDMPCPLPTSAYRGFESQLHRWTALFFEAHFLGASVFFSGAYLH